MTYVELNDKFIEAKDEGFITGSLDDVDFDCTTLCDNCPAADACSYLASKNISDTDVIDMDKRFNNFIKQRKIMLEELNND